MSNWFRSLSGNTMSGYAGYLTRVPLELPIFILINILGLVGSTLNWSWLKRDQDLEKIWELSIVRRSDESNAKDIVWIKTTLSHIERARFIIDQLSLLAYIANIYTILARSWRNLIVFWMLLNFVKDVVLEITVTVATFLLWYWGSVSTSLLLEFILEKTIRLVISIVKWYPTVKVYTHLRRTAEIRRLTIIARKSIASIVPVPGRIGYSLDDESLAIAAARRGRTASLLNQNELFSVDSYERASFELRTTKSVTTLATDDSRDSSNDTNHDDPIPNDLSVAEKSMKMLGITAEDVMDARARIHERPYWNEQDVTGATAESVEEIMAQFSLKREDERDTSNASRKIAETTVDRASRKQDIARHPLTEKEKEKERIDSRSKKRETSIEKQKEIAFSSSARNEEDVAFDKAKEPARTRDFHVTTKITQYPSNENARSTQANKPRKMEARLRSISESREDKRIDEDVDGKKHPSGQVETRLTPNADPNAKRRGYQSPKMSSHTCHCSHANTDARKIDQHLRSIDVKDDDTIAEEESKRFTADIVTQKDNTYSTTLEYSEYRSKMQMQTSRGFRGKREPIAWNSVSLGRTARPSGYEKGFVAAKISFACRKSVQTEDQDESRPKHKRRSQRCGRSYRKIDVQSIYNQTMLKRKMYAESEERGALELRALKAHNDLDFLKDKREARIGKSRKLTVEEREALELRNLRAYNEFTLLEDKKELEAKRRYNSSFNQERSTTVARDENLENHEELSFSEGQRELLESAGRKCDPSRNEEEIEASSTSISDEPRTASHDGINLTEESAAHRLAISNNVNVPNDRDARRTRVSLNLMEITRNIEWTLHPRGIVLTNKNLLSDLASHPENGRRRESRQRDIVDDNTASVLHSAFFFKPEIITRIFRRAQTRLGESLPGFFQTYQREDLGTEFVCRIGNEIFARDRDSLPQLTPLHERLAEDPRGNPRDPLLIASASNNDDHVGPGGRREDNRDLCIIFIDRQEAAASESGTAIQEDSTTIATESREDSSSNDIEDTSTTYVTASDHDDRHQNRTSDNATNDNLPVQFIIDILRNFGIEVAEGRARRLPIERIEEYEDPLASNPITDDDNSPIRAFSENDVNFDEERIYEDPISLDQSAIIDEEIEQISSSSNNYSSDVNVGSSVNSLGHVNSFNSRNKRYLNAIRINSQDKVYESDPFLKSAGNSTLSRSLDLDNDDNREFNVALNRRAEKSSLNRRVLENSSNISFLPPVSSIESRDIASISRSNDEESQRLTRSSDPSRVTLKNERGKSVSSARAESDDRTSEHRNVETFGAEVTTTHDGARSEDDGRENVYERTSVFPTDRFSRLNSSEKLERDRDSFDSTFERNDDSSKTPVSLEVSLMEEFSNDTVPPRTPSDASVRNSQ